MTNTQTKPTLASLGLACTISPNGVRAMNDDGHPMCAWICTFTNIKSGRTENFDYFTDSGCGIKAPKHWLEKRYGFADVKNIMAGNIKDKSLLCRLAHEYNREKKWTPDAIEILWAIARDGDALESVFEDWASDLGYDADSRKAEKVYRACQDNALRLRRILSAENIQTIKELEL